MQLKAWCLWLIMCVNVELCCFFMYMKVNYKEKAILWYTNSFSHSTCDNCCCMFYQMSYGLKWDNTFLSCGVSFKVNVQIRLYILDMVDSHGTMRQCDTERQHSYLPYLTSSSGSWLNSITNPDCVWPKGSCSAPQRPQVWLSLVLLILQWAKGSQITLESNLRNMSALGQTKQSI